MLYFARCPLCGVGVVRPLLTRQEVVVLRCENDGTVWAAPEHVGTESFVHPSAPDWSVGRGVDVTPGTARWATEAEVRRLTRWRLEQFQGRHDPPPSWIGGPQPLVVHPIAAGGFRADTGESAPSVLTPNPRRARRSAALLIVAALLGGPLLFAADPPRRYARLSSGQHQVLVVVMSVFVLALGVGGLLAARKGRPRLERSAGSLTFIDMYGRRKRLDPSSLAIGPYRDNASACVLTDGRITAVLPINADEVARWLTREASGP